MKRVVLCLDGTWNNNRAGSTLTNVAKLHQVIASSDGNGVRQISHYVEGIDSVEGETAEFLKGAVGLGVGERIRKAYELLATDYELGDEIYLIGFSRGAFEARSLGGLITLFGLAKLEGAFSLDKAWSLYHAREKERDQEELAELRSAAHYPVRIKCVGVWDTVGNIGNPFSSGDLIGRRFEFHNTRLSETIDVGLHALSVDELRGPFRPTKAIDDLVWSSVREQAWGSDRRGEFVGQIGTHPPQFDEQFAPLPDAIADRLSQNTEKSAILTLHKVRELLGMLPNQKEAVDIRAQLSEHLTWRELIHTTYFDLPEFVNLTAYGLHRAGLAELNDDFWQGTSRNQVQAWYAAISVPTSAQRLWIAA
jgi:uncharacterized protein (DUF2235 family)